MDHTSHNLSRRAALGTGVALASTILTTGEDALAQGGDDPNKDPLVTLSFPTLRAAIENTSGQVQDWVADQIAPITVLRSIITANQLKQRVKFHTQTGASKVVEILFKGSSSLVSTGAFGDIPPADEIWARLSMLRFAQRAKVVRYDTASKKYVESNERILLNGVVSLAFEQGLTPVAVDKVSKAPTVTLDISRLLGTPKVDESAEAKTTVSHQFDFPRSRPYILPRDDWNKKKVKLKLATKDDKNLYETELDLKGLLHSDTLRDIGRPIQDQPKGYKIKRSDVQTACTVAKWIITALAVEGKAKAEESNGPVSTLVTLSFDDEE